jgi:hypothetical protein
MSELRKGETRAPFPGVEEALDAAMGGQLSMKDFLLQFSDAGLIVVSATDFTGHPEQFQPMLFTPDETPLMAVFTARDRANQWAEKAPFSMTMLGRHVFEGLKDGVGLVVNPGSGLGFEMQPGGVATILAELTSHVDPDVPEPAVALEQAILDAQSGDIEPEELLLTLATSTICVLSETDDGLTPITFVRDDGPTIVGAFTRSDFAAQFAEDVTFVLYVEASWLAANLGEGVGLVVNPGTLHPWELSPEVLAAVAVGRPE